MDIFYRKSSWLFLYQMKAIACIYSVSKFRLHHMTDLDQ